MIYGPPHKQEKNFVIRSKSSNAESLVSSPTTHLGRVFTNKFSFLLPTFTSTLVTPQKHMGSRIAAPKIDNDLSHLILLHHTLRPNYPGLLLPAS